MNRDLGFIQFEVRKISMRLVKTIIVLGRREVSVSADGFGSVVDCPIIEDVSRRSSRRSGACRGTVLDFYGFTCGGNSTHVRAIIIHSIVDGYFVFFPNGVNIIVWLLLVSCDLSHLMSRTVDRSCIFLTVPGQEIGSGAALSLGPALECISGTGLSAEDIYRLIDLYVGIRMIKRTLPTVFRTVVAVPIDMRRGFFFLILVNSLQLDRIVILSVCVYGCRSNNCAGGCVSDLRITL